MAVDGSAAPDGALTNGAAHANGDASTERLQIINDAKEFTSVRPARPRPAIRWRRAAASPDLTAQITRWGLRDAGFAYNIVSVFGSQSTGKSKSLPCL
jgi:hypothetical protein